MAGYGGDGGPARSATLNQAMGVFVDGSGDLYVTDVDRVREVTATACRDNAYAPGFLSHQILDANSDPVANAPVDIQAEPLSTAPAGTPPLDVGSGETDANGFVIAGLPDIGQAQPPDYENSSGVIILYVYNTDASGSQVYAFDTSKVAGTTYYGTGYDPTLEAARLTSGGSPLTNTPVEVEAEPLVPGTYPDVQVGEGSTDGAGHVVAGIDMTAVKNNPIYLSPNFVAQIAGMVCPT